MSQMKIKNIVRVVSVACILCLSMALLVSCAPKDTKNPAELNREYMASISQLTEGLNAELATFVDAAAQGDVPAMKIASDRAEKEMQKIQDLKAPEDLKTAHEEYQAGMTDLHTALNEYIDLYSKIDAGSLASVEANKQLAEVQKTYDSGISHLEKGDALIAKLSSADKKPADKNADKAENADAADSSADNADAKGADNADVKGADNADANAADKK